MKGKKYKINVCTDIAHGWYTDIEEVVLDNGAVFNDRGYIFGFDQERYDEATFLGEVEVDDILAEQFRRYADLETLKDDAKNFFAKEDLPRQE